MKTLTFFASVLLASSGCADYSMQSSIAAPNTPAMISSETPAEISHDLAPAGSVALGSLKESKASYFNAAACLPAIARDAARRFGANFVRITSAGTQTTFNFPFIIMAAPYCEADAFFVHSAPATKGKVKS